MKKLLFALSVLLTAAGAFAATLTLDRVQQRYPWNGLVDIDYTVAGLDGAVEDYNVVLTLTDGEGSRSLVNFVEWSDCDLPVANGSHHVTWNAQADGYAKLASGVSLAAKLVYRPVSEAEAEFMIIDLSAGRTATSYPVKYAAGTLASTFNRDVYKTTKLVLKRVTAGTFMMGETDTNEAKPIHEVTLTKDYFLDLFPLTHAQYSLVLANGYKTTAQPFTPDSKHMIAYWKDYMADNGLFAAISSKLTFKGEAVGRTLTMPTEAQWEYACRAGTTTKYFWGDDTTDANRYCWDSSLWGGMALPDVGTKEPNPWGFYDMTGLVFEFCLDWRNSYTADPVSNPCATEPQTSTTEKVQRGGSCRHDVTYARSGRRNMTDKVDAYRSWSGDYVGVRPALTLADAGRTDPAAAEEQASATKDAIALDTRADAVRVVIDTGDILPFAYNNDPGWAAAGGGADVATVAVESLVGSPEEDPSAWSATGERTVLAAEAGAGTVEWQPTVQKLYKATLTVGATELAAFFDLTQASGLAAPVDVSSAEITFSQGIFACDGDEHVPAVTVSMGENPLTPGTDYAVTHTDAVNPGLVTITVIGIGAYTGRVTKDYLISDPVVTELASDELTGCPAVDTRADEIRDTADISEILPFAWNGGTGWPAGGEAGKSAAITVFTMNAVDPSDVSTWSESGESTNVLVATSGEGASAWTPDKQSLYKAVLTQGSVASVAYFDLQDCQGLQEVVDISTLAISVSVASFAADGDSHEPEVIVKDENESILVKGRDYIYTISDTINAGTAVVTVSGIGMYTGTAFTSYEIVPVTPASFLAKTTSDGVPVDGDGSDPLVLRNPQQLKPVAWNSSCEWTLGGSAVEGAKARVSVAELADADAEPADWTVLKEAEDEGTFNWATHKGWWKLRLEFLDGDGQVIEGKTLYRTIDIVKDGGFLIRIR